MSASVSSFVILLFGTSVEPFQKCGEKRHNAEDNNFTLNAEESLEGVSSMANIQRIIEMAVAAAFKSSDNTPSPKKMHPDLMDADGQDNKEDNIKERVESRTSRGSGDAPGVVWSNFEKSLVFPYISGPGSPKIKKEKKQGSGDAPGVVWSNFEKSLVFPYISGPGSPKIKKEKKQAVVKRLRSGMDVTDVGLDGLHCFLLLFLSLSSPRGCCNDLRGLQCFRLGLNSDMNCTWAYEGEHGEDTVLTLYYRSLKFHTDQFTPAIFSVPRGQSWVMVAREDMTSHDTCEVWIEGVGVSGRVTSQHRTFDLQAIVVLSPPLLSVEEISGMSSENMLVNLELSSFDYYSGSLKCELQYREQGNHNWSKVISECDYPSHQELLNLKAFTLYEVQARYIRTSGNIIRSVWSEPITFRSPEAAPLGKVDAWRSLENGGLLVTWKALDPSAARSHSISYILSYWESSQARHVVRSVPCCNITLPGTMYNASIAANSSLGQTEPTDLYLEPAGLAATTQFWIQRTSGPAFNISWIPNDKQQKKLQEYLLEWRSAVQGDSSGIQWRRFTASTGLHSVLLSDNFFQPSRPYKISLYGLYLHGYGELNSSICYIQEGVPSRGPPVAVHALSSSSALVTLGELPLHERRGIITHYSIFVVQVASGKVLQGINVSTAQNITISNLEPSTEYLLHVSASTSAGESSKFVYPFVTSGASVGAVYAAILVTVLLLAACVLGIVFRGRIRDLGRELLPKFCWQKIPDPVHSRMILKVANYKDMGDWMNLQSQSPDLHQGPEEPHITEVEELEEPPPRLIAVEGEHSGEENEGQLLGSSSDSARQPDSMRTDAAGMAQAEWRQPIMSGYEKHFMPTAEDLEQFTGVI
ncbi:hypothetical protein NDU88_001389 [Pleurodeles waltl]|uniref:Fibronectin type-III domain-containing protein n=1 Tax=Pleurodeles waltl TaxID=8319 RepID=A0AAV7S8U4_PLEWA|nr:hypothetical protein NDU88_001389 [Pleurodeles waltl]